MARIVGGFGPDRLRGGAADDRIFGGEAGDLIRGGGGDDRILGFDPSDPSGARAFIASTRIETGIERLLFAATAPGDERFIHLVGQGGEVRRFDPETGVSRPFLELPEGSLSGGNEEGLLGLAFHPDYERNGRFFLHLVNAEGDVEIVEHRRGANGRAEPGEGRTILTIPHPDFSNHNGGTVLFGPDGLLYVSIGDGGGGGDPNDTGQDPSDLLGSILRIDVDRDGFPGNPARNYAIPEGNPFAAGGGAPEVWDFGLRNPFRFGFDPATGDLLIGDVGQGAREEIDLHPAGAPGGLNFGWDVKEGTTVFDPGDPGEPPPRSPSLVDPVFEYDRTVGRTVTGGGFAPEGGGLAGAHVFADFITGRLFTLRVEDGRAVEALDRSQQIRGEALDLVAAFATGPDGALYAVSLTGALFRLEFGTGAGDGADRLRGGRGDDTLDGGAGDDRLAGQSGADRLRGGVGDDRLFGGDEGDALFGGRGADRLAGGAGGDRISGGGGGDRFVFAAAVGRDVVADFGRGADRVDLTAYGLADAGEALDALSDRAGGALLDLSALGGGGFVRFEGVARVDFDAGDFLI